MPKETKPAKRRRKTTKGPEKKTTHPEVRRISAGVRTKVTAALQRALPEDVSAAATEDSIHSNFGAEIEKYAEASRRLVFNLGNSPAFFAQHPAIREHARTDPSILLVVDDREFAQGTAAFDFENSVRNTHNELDALIGVMSDSNKVLGAVQCRKRECREKQLGMEIEFIQKRSADEPQNVYATCRSCGTRISV